MTEKRKSYQSRRKKMKQSVRKTLLSFLAAVCLLVAAAFVTACGPKEATLTFETNGGSAIASITAEIGAEIVPPQNPEKEGYVFEGWYLTAETDGDSVQLPTVMPEKDTTYYAKFTEIPSAMLTLDAAQGTIATTSYKIAIGAKVAPYLQGVTPVAEGLTFGGWFMDNGRQLSDTQVMPSGGLKLTARYKVNYTVEVFLQNAEGEGYTQDANATLTGSDWIGAAINRTTSGLTVPAGYRFNASLSPELVLTEKAGENVFRAHFDRSTYNVFYLGNEPQGMTATGTMERETVRDGAVITVKESGYSLEGYLFAGWATSSAGAIEYRPGDELTVTGNTQLYACWNFGMSDAEGGSDIIYILAEREGTVMLNRAGLEAKYGEYSAQTRIFTFTTDSGKKLSGRVSADGKTFTYVDLSVAMSYQKYDWNADQPAVVSSETIALNADGTATYKVGDTEKKGTYEAFAYGYNFIPDGEEDGAFYFTLSEENGVKVFLISDGYQGAYYFMDGDGKIYYYPLVVLDGFGGAIYGESQTSEVIEADYVTEGNIIYLNKNGETILSCMVSVVDTTTGESMPVFVKPDEYINRVFTAKSDNGNISLALDGFGNAVYIDEKGEQHETVYQINDGYFTAESNYVYILFLVDGEAGKEVRAIRYDLNELEETVLATDYNAYTEASATSGYTARIRIDGATAIIEFRMQSGAYRKIIEGTCVADENTKGRYTFTATNIDENYREMVEGIYSSFTFGLFQSGSSVVFIIEDDYVGTYTFTNGGSKVSLTCKGYGVADLVVDANEAVQVKYAVLEGYADENGDWVFITFVNGETTYVIKVDKNGKGATTLIDTANAMNRTFTDLNNRFAEYTETLRMYPDGMAVISVQIDGQYVPVVTGKYVPHADMEGFYVFTVNGTPDEAYACYRQFVFTCVSQGSSAYYFCRYNEDEILSIEQGDQKLSLNGYGLAMYNEKQYLYTWEGDVISLSAPSGSGTATIILAEDHKSFVASGPEQGTYYAYVDGMPSVDEYMINLDGFGKATLLSRIPADEEAGTEATTVTVAEGTYTVGEKDYTVTFPDTEIKGFSFTIGRVSLLGIPIPVYLKADESAVCHYTIENGGTIDVDRYKTVTYTNANGDARNAKIGVIADPYAEEEAPRTLLALYDAAGSNIECIFVVGENNSLRPLDTLYGSYRQLIGASISGSSFLVLDGLGGARMLGEEGALLAVGTYAASETVENNYVFTSLTEGVESFTFTLRSVKSTEGKTYAVFLIYNADWNRTFVSEDWEVITLDGYGKATYIDEKGVAQETYYEIAEGENGETLVGLFSAAAGEYVYYVVDLEKGTFCAQ